jgi:predicted acylesterase/phospholipase RssA
VASADTPANVAAVPATPAGADSSGTRWALALSGGIARGIGHIGVLRALEEQHLRPDLIVGTSMGSLVGALWASGRSSAELRELVRTVDAQGLFAAHPRSPAWRDHVVPRPWFTLVGYGGFLRLPRGMLEDVALNDLLARHLLVSDGLAQGDFDRLPIPWRAVASEMRTLGPVVLDRGSVAHAVRASVSIPMVFPGVWTGTELLVDGGMASHLPMIAARADSADHVLGIDVALPMKRIDDLTPAVRVGMATTQLSSQRGRTDARPGRDHVIWLKMNGASPADFRMVDTLIERGYRESRDTIAALARAWGLPRSDRSRVDPLLPRLGGVAWVTREGRAARGSTAAADLFQPLPAGPFAPDSLAPALARVHRGDLFLAAWPRFRSDPNSTTLTIEVQEHEPLELAGAPGYDTDEGGRLHLSLDARPIVGRRPSAARVGAVYRRFTRAAFLSLEPRSLARGAMGPFLRGGARRTETRVFERGGRWRQERTERAEVMIGGQLRLRSADVVQVGAGMGRVWAQGRTREGPMAALRLEHHGRRSRQLDVVALGGDDSYGALRAAVAVELPFTWATLRPGAAAGWASRGAPLDEWPALGGPALLSGLRRGEWLGRRSLAAELRAVRHLFTGLEAHATVQAGHVDRALGRRDLSGRPRIAAGLGLHANVPFGPLTIEGGLTEGGNRRLYVGLGQAF